MSKKCIQCNKTKDVSMYGKNKLFKNGVNSKCKECNNMRIREYRRTKIGVISKMYGSQKQRSKTRGHRPPEYTNVELREWLFSQTLFHELYSEWSASGYKQRLIPSVDRKCDDIHYCMSNIQLMTWGENKAKGHKDMRTGRLKCGVTSQTIVKQYTKKGVFITKYHSLMEAERQTGVNNGNISLCCSKKIKTAGGFKWEYDR